MPPRSRKGLIAVLLRRLFRQGPVNGGKSMFEAIGCEDSRKGENLLGLLRYYELILKRKGLAARMGEIRSLKLGLILDLLTKVSIAEELKAKLVSSIVSAWEMNGNDKTLSMAKRR
jgi:hypothetical protein